MDRTEERTWLPSSQGRGYQGEGTVTSGREEGGNGGFPVVRSLRGERKDVEVKEDVMV